MRKLYLSVFILIFSVNLISCSDRGNDKNPLNEVNSKLVITEKEEIALEILRKIVVAEKRFAVKNGYYAEIKELSEKNFLIFDDSVISESGYKIRIEHEGVKEIEIFMNPLKSNKGDRISFYTDQTGIIRGGDHGGNDSSPGDPVIGD